MYISQWKCRQLHDASSEFIDEVIRSACYACSKNGVLRPLVSLGLLVSLPIFCGHGKTISVACVCVFRPGNKFFSRLAWYHLGQIVKSNLWIKLYDHRRKHVRCQSGWCDLEWGCLTTQAGDRSVHLALINGACTILNETVRWVMLPDVSADCIRTRELHRIEWIGTSLADSRPVDIVTLITF